MRPTWAEISLTALRHNFRTIRDYVAPSATVCAIVKADAYGHGAAECAKALEEEGALWFGVSCAEEGAALRESGITGRILLASGFWRGEEETIVKHDLTPAVWDWDHIELLEEAARKIHRGKSHPAPVHLKIDTGMTRLGIAPANIASFAETIKSAEHVVLEGVFTHLASAEVLDAPSTEGQISLFNNALGAIRASGLSPIYRHMANSAAIVTRESTWMNMVRPGISLYGYYLPFTSIVSGTPDQSLELPVTPVLTWKTRIMAVRDVPERQPISYNGSYVTQAPAKIAVLPVGYADGLDRHLSSRGRVIVRDDYAAIVGTITMDMTMIDVTGIPGAGVGEEVILIGRSQRRSITAWEHASLASTIPYEILCGISKRVSRKYVK